MYKQPVYRWVLSSFFISLLLIFPLKEHQYHFEFTFARLYFSCINTNFLLLIFIIISNYSLLTDPCLLADACGVNAKCTTVNHQKICTCPSPLVGDARVACKQTFLPCSSELECLPGQICYGRSCYSTCRRLKYMTVNKLHTIITMS